MAPQRDEVIEAIKENMRQANQFAVDELDRLGAFSREKHTAEEWTAYRSRVAKFLLLSMFCTVSVQQCLTAIGIEKGRPLTFEELLQELKRLLAEGEPKFRAWFSDQMSGPGKLQ